MLNHRILKLAVTAITIASAAGVTSLYATSASAATGPVHIIHRGLVKDCVYIESFETNLEIKGNGVNKPTTLTPAPGNCFDLYNEFSYDGYTGYEYQNGDGHCLWDNGGTIDVGAACIAGHPKEEFYGISFTRGEGWTVGDVEEGPSVYLSVPLVAISPSELACPVSGEAVGMASGSDDCNLWNFPS
jgi:hypothetical protein